jgi:hypothetical protein
LLPGRWTKAAGRWQSDKNHASDASAAEYENRFLPSCASRRNEALIPSVSLQGKRAISPSWLT